MRATSSATQPTSGAGSAASPIDLYSDALLKEKEREDALLKEEEEEAGEEDEQDCPEVKTMLEACDAVCPGD